MPTTPMLIEFLLHKEGFKSPVYDDARPWLQLTEGDEASIEGTLTYGHGLTMDEYGQPLKIGMTITERQSRERVYRYIKDVVEPTLENIIHIELTEGQYDALGSCIYQFGPAEVSGWRLIRRINAGEDWEKIILEWVNGTVMWRGRPLFWARRVGEIFMYLNLDWRAADNVPDESDILQVVEDMGFVEVPKPGPVHQPIFMDPTPDTPVTTEDLNYMQYKQMGGESTFEDFTKGKIAITPITKVVPVEAVDYLSEENKKPGNITVKRLEDSKRAKGYAKSEASKGLGVAGASGTAAVAIGAAEPVVKFVDKYPASTIAYVFFALMLISVVLYFYGKWERQGGENDAEDLLG